MPLDPDLANRLRQLLAGEPDLSEKPMFGGLAFLVGGHLAVSASRQGGILLRVDPSETAKLLARSHTRPFAMRGRVMDGWLLVDAEGLRTRRQLEGWVSKGVAYVRSLPPKVPKRPAVRSQAGSSRSA